MPVLGQNKLRTWRGRRVDFANDLELIEVSATALRPLIPKLRSFVLNRSFHKLKVQLGVFLWSKIRESNRQASAFVKQASEVIGRKFHLQHNFNSILWFLVSIGKQASVSLSCCIYIRHHRYLILIKGHRICSAYQILIKGPSICNANLILIRAIIRQEMHQRQARFPW